MSTILAAEDVPPSTVPGTRRFRMCVPQEWYRRSNSRSTSAPSLENLFQPPAAVADDDDDDDEGDGTAKAGQAPTLTPSASAGSPRSMVDSRSQNRLSSMFSVDSWLNVSASPSMPNPSDKISAPVNPDHDSEDDEQLDDEDNEAFDKMIVRQLAQQYVEP